MDVTPQELRGTEIKEAWRGFNRDEVDDLLERAASTIEHLQRQLHEFETRLATAPASAPSGEAAPLPVNRDDAEMLQRTLLLAQRAADDAVNEAQARARQLVDEAETRAQSLVGEAESTARRIAESERRRLEDEISDLAARRDELAVDADALDAYVSSYRDRLRHAIEADLERLTGGGVEPPSPRPELHEVELPPERVDRRETERAPWDARTASGDATGEQSNGAKVGGSARGSDAEWPPATDATRSERAPQDEPAPGAAAPTAAAAASAAASPTPTPPGAGEQPSSWLSDVEPPSGPESDAPAPWDHLTAEHQPFAADTPIEAHQVADDDIDDDAFFASLRDAVRDDAPLGALDEHTAFFEDEPADNRRGFRRRR
jgi:cell division septum initiation protein DivIVA